MWPERTAASITSRIAATCGGRSDVGGGRGAVCGGFCRALPCWACAPTLPALPPPWTTVASVSTNTRRTKSGIRGPILRVEARRRAARHGAGPRAALPRLAGGPRQPAAGTLARGSVACVTHLGGGARLEQPLDSGHWR